MLKTQEIYLESMQRLGGYRVASDVQSGWEEEVQTGSGGRAIVRMVPRSVSCPPRGADGGLYVRK